MRPRSDCRACAGYEDESHSGVEAAEDSGGGYGKVVSYAGVVGFVHAGGGDTQAVEAGIEAGEITLSIAE